MRKIILLRLLLLIISMILISGCATVGVEEADDDAVITGIRLEDNKLIITSNKNFTYTLYGTGDPYKVALEIPDMKIGSYREKITSSKAGITEVIPQQIDTLRTAVKIDIVLQNPSVVVPVYEDNRLELMVKGEESEAEEPELYEEEPVAVAEIEEAAGILEPSDVTDVEEVTSEEIPVAEIDVSSMPEATEITSVDIKSTPDAVQVLITADGTLVPNIFPIDQRIVIDIPNVAMYAILPTKVISPLLGIRSGKHPDKLRFVLDLKEQTNYDVAAVGNSIVISLQKEAVAEVQAVEQPPTEAPLEEVLPSEPEPKKLFEEKYSGKRISLDFQDADIVPIFRLLADVSGYNIVVHPGIKGTITLKLINVPWDQALDLILRTFQLSKVVEGNIIRVVPTKIIAKELDEIAKAKKAETEAGEVKTVIFPVNYADLDKLKVAIENAHILSSRGSITLDERGSSIIVNDLEPNLKKANDLISQIDRKDIQARQVLIEARIVEVDSTYVKDLGIQWGAFWRNPPTGGDHNFIISKDGTNEMQTVTDGIIETVIDPFVNLPATTGLGTGGSFGIGYLNRNSTLVLNLQLSAMEQLKKGKVLSNPKIMTMNNQEAKISQGSTIYLGTAVADKIDYKAIDALLSLNVTPRIAPGGAIFMDLKITKDEAGTVTEGGVDVLKNIVETMVLINDSETVVIGGIYKQNQVDTDDAVPYLNKIPILGYLFKKKRTISTNTEILIFITPKIVQYNAKR